MCSLKKERSKKTKDKDTIEKMESPEMAKKIIIISKKWGGILLAKFFFKMAKSMW